MGAIACLMLPVAALAQMKGTGRVHIKPVQSYSGSATLAKPASIVVYRFAVSDDEVKLNSSALNRVRTRIRGHQEDEKTKLAHKVTDDFSKTLEKELEKSGMVVSQGVLGEPAPEGSLVVQGDFLLIDEGNQTRRMAIGLGVGASKVEAHVESYLRAPERNVLVTEFNATSESAIRPGAAETMGAGAAPEVAAATSGVAELKQGAVGDVDRMAKAVAKELMKTMKANGWTTGL